MSAYVVEDKTISRILSYLEHQDDWSKGYILRQCAEHGIAGDLAMLGQRMMDLNVLAVNVRYGESYEADRFTFTYEIVDKMQAYKSLCCWSYQCAEGEIPEKSRLYRLMETLKGTIAASIVADLPAWNQAEWG